MDDKLTKVQNVFKITEIVYVNLAHARVSDRDISRRSRILMNRQHN